MATTNVPAITTVDEFKAYFRRYIYSLHTSLEDAARYFAPTMTVNGEAMAASDFTAQIRPGSTFNVPMIVADVRDRTLAVRMIIDLPIPSTLGLGLERPKGTRLEEHVFYHFNEHWLMDEVWSIYGHAPPRLRQSPTAHLPLHSTSRLLPPLAVPTPPTPLLDHDFPSKDETLGADLGQHGIDASRGETAIK